MKFEQKIFLQASMGFDGNLLINASTSEMQFPDYVTIATKTIEFDAPDINMEQYKSRVAKNLNEQKTKINIAAEKEIHAINGKLAELEAK